MAAPTKKIFSVGANSARIYELNSSGYLNGTSATTPYDGVLLGGFTTLTLTYPDPTQVVHPGNNTVLQRDQLPSTDTSTGTLTVSRQDDDTIAIINNTKVVTVGESNVIGWGTNQEGNEPTLTLVAYNQAKDNSGNRVWHTYVMPRVILSAKPQSMQREQSDLTYTLTPMRTSKNIGGVALSASTDGFTLTEVFDFQSNNRLHFAAFLGNNSATAFSFAAGLQAANTTGTAVWVNGVLKTGGGTDYTAATDKITFGSAPASNAVIIVMYELASSAVDVD